MSDLSLVTVIVNDFAVPNPLASTSFTVKTVFPVPDSGPPRMRPEDVSAVFDGSDPLTNLQSSGP